MGIDAGDHRNAMERTLPSGAGWAVMVRAIETAIRDRVTQFFLMASGAGEILYRALGHETYESPEYWMVTPPPEG